MTQLVNDIKSKSGTDQLYLERDDMEKTMKAETDQNRKAIFQWINDKVDQIDRSKAGLKHDGFIGAGDLGKYFGITQ